MTTTFVVLYITAQLLCAGFLCYGIVHPERFQRRRPVKPADTFRPSLPGVELGPQGS